MTDKIVSTLVISEKVICEAIDYWMNFIKEQTLSQEIINIPVVENNRPKVEFEK